MSIREELMIRQAALSDHEQIVAMDKRIFGAYGAEEDPAIIQARLEVFPQGCAILETVDNDAEDTDAEDTDAEDTDGQRFMGYLTTEIWSEVREPALDEDPRETHDPSGHILNITTLAISPDQQSRGHGKRLLDHAIHIAHTHNCDRIILETAHAQRFYLRHGFTIVDERRQRDIPLTVMERILTDGTRG